VIRRVPTDNAQNLISASVLPPQRVLRAPLASMDGPGILAQHVRFVVVSHYATYAL
jgi:hypothetical protein